MSDFFFVFAESCGYLKNFNFYFIFVGVCYFCVGGCGAVQGTTNSGCAAADNPAPVSTWRFGDCVYIGFRYLVEAR